MEAKFGPLEKGIKLLISLKIKFFRTVTLFDHRKNEEIFEELKVKPVCEKLRRYKSNWLWHATRMNRMPKVMLNYRPKV